MVHEGVEDSAVRRQSTAELNVSRARGDPCPSARFIILRLERNSNGTILQDLWARAGQRAVFRQGAQNSCVQGLPEFAKERTPGHRRPGRYLRLYAPISYFQEKRGRLEQLAKSDDAR